MAPVSTELTPNVSHRLQGLPSKALFPDGIKTSGQHPPLYHELRPFDEFPVEISGPTVWKADDYIHNPERWVHDFSVEEIDEMSKAADNFLAASIPLTGITKVIVVSAFSIEYVDFLLLGQFSAAANGEFAKIHTI